MSIKTSVLRFLNQRSAKEFSVELLDHSGANRRMFLDCGANNGCSVRKFRAEIDTACEYEIYSFEPNPEFAGSFERFEKHVLVPKAVWTHDGSIEFYNSMQEDRFGGTIVSGKTTGSVAYDRPMLVDSIDFSGWIESNLAPADFVILKLDIEGAEYEVLQQLIDQGTIHLIDLLFIEWHLGKIDVSIRSHRKILRGVEAAGLTPYHWHAAEYI